MFYKRSLTATLVTRTFITVESQFIKTGIINEETKYHHVVSSLSDDLSAKVIHILTNPPENNKYTYSKCKLLALLQPTKALNAT